MTVGTASGFTTQDSYVPDRLFAGDYPRKSGKRTLLQGEVRRRGAVLGRITANGKYRLSLAAAVDGSAESDAILAEDADASASDVEVLVYFTGDFNEDALEIGADQTSDGIRQGLRERGIFIEKTQPAAA